MPIGIHRVSGLGGRSWSESGQSWTGIDAGRGGQGLAVRNRSPAREESFRGSAGSLYFCCVHGKREREGRTVSPAVESGEPGGCCCWDHIDPWRITCIYFHHSREVKL